MYPPIVHTLSKLYRKIWFYSEYARDDQKPKWFKACERLRRQIGNLFTHHSP